ncbi:RDD family protein [Streptomyces sp. NPDC004031]
MSQPPGPPYPYGGQPQQPPSQPYGQMPPGVPPQVPYGQPAGYGYQQPYGYAQPGGVPPGMPPLASWGARLGSLLLDFLIVNLVPAGVYLAGYIPHAVKVQQAYNKCADHGISQKNCHNVPDATSTNVTLMVVGGILLLAATIFLSYREGKTGQTPGRKIVGIRLLRERDGSATGFGRAFGRRLLHILDGIPCGLGYLWPLWDSKNQTWADKMVGTVVVKDQF